MLYRINKTFKNIKILIFTFCFLSFQGQSILRNLTTSPFSQKKNTPNINVQPNQIDPLWRMPTTQDVPIAFDACDNHTSSAIANPPIATTTTDSPAFQRKRFQVGTDSKFNMTSAKKTSNEAEKHQQQQQETKPSMIPLTKNEAQPQRVPGNHSPIGKN